MVNGGWMAYSPDPIRSTVVSAAGLLSSAGPSIEHGGVLPSGGSTHAAPMLMYGCALAGAKSVFPFLTYVRTKFESTRVAAGVKQPTRKMPSLVVDWSPSKSHQAAG